MKTSALIMSAVLSASMLLSGCPRQHYHVDVGTRTPHGDHDKDHDRDHDKDRDRDRRRDWDHDNRRAYPQASAEGIIIEVRAPTYYESIRIRNLANSLDFSGQPMVNWWRIVVLPRAEWEDALRYYHLEGQTDSAFTIMAQNETLVNEDYTFFAGTYRLRFTLAHEAGHLICQCQSEGRADSIARILTKKYLAD